MVLIAIQTDGASEMKDKLTRESPSLMRSHVMYAHRLKLPKPGVISLTPVPYNSSGFV
jgi:hypothetical protein